MCGLVGFITNNNNIVGSLNEIVEKMSSSIDYRGPDDSGVWTNESVGIALGHRRLSILDLSQAGHQPMISATGRFVIAYNGEIYNHLELRSELLQLGVPDNWSGHSDTETLLAGIEQWGITSTLTKAIGMFAFALWDKETETLHLVRDRFGEKPLYYGWSGESISDNKLSFVFGSELKALKKFPNFSNKICQNALANYLRFLYVPAPESIYEDIYKLEPGCILSIKSNLPAAPNHVLSAPYEDHKITLKRWWSLAEVVEIGSKNFFENETYAIAELHESLKRAVKSQSLADVPLGAFLSGGVDSSLIVALMQEHHVKPIKTFTVGFEESNFDESPFAKAVSDHLGTDHCEIKITAKETLELVPQLAKMYDEPFADSSQIPTHLVCKAARQQVTVAVSGDAGDELFGGYNRYLWGPKLWKKISWMPYPIRKLLGKCIIQVPIAFWDILEASFNFMSSQSTGINHLGNKAHKFGSKLKSVKNVDDLNWSFVYTWHDPSEVLLRTSNPEFNYEKIYKPKNGIENPQLNLMYIDSITYLPGDILCKVDRAAMSIGLETRIPFLDKNVAEVAWRLPLNMKIRGNEGKWALRQILYKYVPRELIERPKAGFSVPLSNWLRGPLREWAEELLSEKKLLDQGFFKPEIIEKKWKEHLKGNKDYSSELWAILMFQSWLELNTEQVS